MLSASPRSPHFLPSLLRGFSVWQRPELQGLPATVPLAGPVRSRGRCPRVLQASRFGCSCPVLGLMCLLSPLALQSPGHPFPLSPLRYKELSGSAFSDRMIYPLPVWVPEPRIFLTCVCLPDATAVPLFFRSMPGTLHIHNLQCCWEGRPAASRALAGKLVWKLKAEPVDLLQARHPQLYLLLLSAPLVASLDFLWETGTFGRERTLSIYAFPRLRRHLCFGDKEGVTGLLGEGNGALLPLGSENLGGILFAQLFPRLLHPVYDPSLSSLRTGPGSCRHKADAHPRGVLRGDAAGASGIQPGIQEPTAPGRKA